MRKTKLILWTMLVCSFFSARTLAQLTVTGKVADAATGEALPGVSIILVQDATKGITGIATDNKGNFRLEIPEATGTLQFTFVGYKNQKVDVTSANATDLTVKLVSDVARLDEVVVTGLATNVKRSNLANAVSTVSGKDLTGTTAPQTFDGALSGKVVGANIISSSGAPGGGIAVKMRGVTTFYAESQPLYVVDGVYMDNSSISPGLNFVTAAQAGGNPFVQDNQSNRIADLNPNDIENVEILKGASAAAIYGSKAAAGVVIITTKKGLSTGRTNINFSQDIGVASARKLLGVRTLDAQKVEDAYGPSAVPLFNDAQASGKIYDYEEEMYGEKGVLTNTRLSLSGGTNKTSFFISGGLKKENGIIKNTGYINRSVRGSFEHKLGDKITLSFASNFINSSSDRGLTNNDNNGVTYGISLAFTPSFVELHPDENGIYPDNPFAASNVLQTRDLAKNNETTYRTLNNLNIKAFLQQNNKSVTKLVMNGAGDFYVLRTLGYFPPSLQFQSGTGTNGAVLQGRSTNLNLNFYGALVNTLTASENLNFTSSIGATYEGGDLNYLLIKSSELIGTQQNVNQAGATSVDQNREKFRNNGYLVQEEINFKDQLMFTAGVRLDRTTLAGEIKKYFTYPKASLAWNISKMGFWKSENFENLKLRVAYGQSGNLPRYSSKYTLFDPSNTGGPGSVIGLTKGDPNIIPERQTELEGGLDLSYKGRISFEATIYNKKCYDLILYASIPQSSGFTYEWLNGGELVNNGIELGLGIIPVNAEKFKWETKISWWKNKSEVTKLAVPAFSRGAFGNSLGSFYIEEGKSATQIIGFTGNTLPDGEPEVGVLGDAAPDFQMNFLNEITLMKNIGLRFLIHWKKGGDNINLTELLTDLGGTSPDFDDDANGNGVKDGLDRIADLGVSAEQFVQDASYVKVREIGLFYTFSSSFITGNVVRGLRLGISANNYFTFTDYKSYDPEVSNFGIDGISTGVEVTPYPSSKRIFFHLSVDF